MSSPVHGVQSTQEKSPAIEARPDTNINRNTNVRSNSNTSVQLSKSPDVVELTPRRIKKLGMRKRKVRFESVPAETVEITEDDDMDMHGNARGELSVTEHLMATEQVEEANPIDELLVEVERQEKEGQEMNVEACSSVHQSMEIVPANINNQEEEGGSGEMYPPHCAQPSIHDNGRQWLYPLNSPIMVDHPSFDLGIITPPNGRSKGKSTVMLSAINSVRRSNLFDEQSYQPACPDGSNMNQTGRTTCCASVSPISRTRTVAACLLEFREEVEAGCVNLNMQPELGSGSGPYRKRRVIPGPAGRSPFVMQYRLSERASGSATHLYVKFIQMNRPVMENNWVVSPVPSYIELTGDTLKSQLGAGGSIQIDLMNVFMRRFQQLENYWACDHGDTPWRHLLEVEFVNHVMRGGNYIKSAYVRDLFVGEHLTHDVHRCPMLVLPVIHADAWSTYVFDFSRKRTTILDPMIYNGDRPLDEVQSKHGKIVDELRVAILECIHEYFDGWAPKASGWTNWFPKQSTGPWVCTRAASGIFALHNARQWMGTKLQRTLTPMAGDLDQYRMMLLYDVSGTRGNIGQLPSKFKICQSQDHKKK